jgi:hypothetical protein
MTARTAPKKLSVILVAVTTEIYRKINIVMMTLSPAKISKLPETMRILDIIQISTAMMNQKRDLKTCYSKLRSQVLRSIRRTQSYRSLFPKRRPESITQNQYYKFWTNSGY